MCLRIANFDLPFTQTKDNFVGMFGRPDDSSYRGLLLKFVTDTFLITPFCANLVDENDIIGLCYSDLGRVWGKCQTFHSIRFRALETD